MVFYRDIIESRGYEHAAPETPLVIRYGSYDMPVLGIEIDNDEQMVAFLSSGTTAFALADLLNIDVDELAEIIEHQVFVDSVDDEGYFAVDDIFLTVDGDGNEIFVFFCD